jgi:hypothetical protein
MFTACVFRQSFQMMYRISLLTTIIARTTGWFSIKFPIYPIFSFTLREIHCLEVWRYLRKKCCWGHLELRERRLSPLGTAATLRLIVPTPNDRWWWRRLWSNRWNANWQGKPKYSKKTCLSATLSTKNPTWPDPGSNPGRRCRKPATNRLSYGTALKERERGMKRLEDVEHPVTSLVIFTLY